MMHAITDLAGEPAINAIIRKFSAASKKKKKWTT